MPARHTVVVGHAEADVRRALSAILADQPDLHLVGVASSGAETIRQVTALRPTLVLLDGDFRDVNSFQIISQIVQTTPRTGVIVLASSQDFGFIRRIMQAGARSFLIAPLEPDTVLMNVRQVAARVTPTPAAPAERHSKLLVAFGPKGGVGKTTVSVNLALALRQRTGAAVGLVDADLAFGDTHLTLNLSPQYSIVDFVEQIDGADQTFLYNLMAAHPSGVRILASPPRPELAELITAEHVRKLQALLYQTFDYTIVDGPVAYDERVLAWFDVATHVLLVLTPEVGPIHNAIRFLELTRALGFARDRLKIVLNRADSQVGITAEDVAHTLGQPVSFKIPSGGRLVATSVNLGNPFVLTHPTADVSRAIGTIVDFVVQSE